MVEFFAEHQNLIVYLHVISAVIWVGGMIAMRFAAHQSFSELEGKERLIRASHGLKRLFTMVTPFVIVLIATAVIMAVGFDFRDLAIDETTGLVRDAYAMKVYNVVHIKEAIWMVMAMNLALMAWIRFKANKNIEIDIDKAKGGFWMIATYLVPLNIILGLIAIFLGVLLRNGGTGIL